jgi:peptidoglycan/LPS O-acetylase OafA/YrhL
VWSKMWRSICYQVSEWATRRLSRVTSSGEFIPEVDGIRFLAIFAVLVFHTCSDLYIARGGITDWAENHGRLLHLMGMGWYGVEIFFFLSGFIVALPFARKALEGSDAPDLGRYFLRRLTRIEPPYILSLTAMYLLSRKLSTYFPDYIASLFYSHQYVFATSSPFAIVTWSLEVEVIFYILAPWLTRVYRIRRPSSRWLVQLLLIGVSAYAARWLVVHGGARIQNTLATMIPFFLAGMLLADLYASGLVQRSRQICWDFAVAASVVLLVKGIPSNLYWFSPMMIMLLVAGIIRGRAANWFFRFRPVTLIGGMCYTLYLWHALLLHVLPRWLKNLTAPLPYVEAAVVYCLIVVPCLIAICVPIFLLIEKPFMNGPGSRYIENRLHSISNSLRRRTPLASDAAA